MIHSCINGTHEKDPLGPHVTVCYKDENQLLHGTHVASHGYVRGKDDIGFVRATHAGEGGLGQKATRQKDSMAIGK